jgi:peroxiredoxin
MFKRRLFRILAGVCLIAGLACTAEVPRPSPDFAVRMVDGKQILLSGYKGQVCVLAFILTYCSHCQKTVGVLSTMEKEFGSQGLQVVASAIEDMAAMNVPDFIKHFQPPFPVGFNQHKPVLEYLQHPAMFKLLMPQLVFIDRQGIIRAQYAGDDNKFFSDDLEKNMRAQIISLLKEEPAPPKKPASARKKAA